MATLEEPQLLTLGACASEGYSNLSVCLSGLNLLLQGSRATRYYLYVRVFHNECKDYYVWNLIKTYGFKVMKRSTFHADPRPSLWRWRAQAGRSHVDRQV